MKLPKIWNIKARWHKVLCWEVNKLRGSSQYGLVPVEDRSVVIITHKEKVKERWAEHLKNAINLDGVAGKTQNFVHKKCCNTLGVKEDLFCEEELATVLNG